MVTIREINENDFPTLIELFKEFATFQKSAQQMTNSVEQMQKEMEYIGGYVAISAENSIVGYATCFFAYYSWIGKSLHLDDLYVKPEFRGKGVGTLLITKIKEHAINSNCKKLSWQVSNWNQPAIAFYKSLGATIDTDRSDCYLWLNRG